MQSIFFSSTTDAPPGVSGVSKDQNFHAKSDFSSLKRQYSIKIEKTPKTQKMTQKTTVFDHILTIYSLTAEY